MLNDSIDDNTVQLEDVELKIEKSKMIKVKS
jgi:hypothetical protein